MKKILKLILFILLVLALYLFVGKAKPAEKMEWGVTFSRGYAADFEPNWQKVFLSVLDDLKVKRIRLIAYWSEIEKAQGKFDFQDLDWQINQASKREVEIILAVGRRLPRWPECFSPDWAKNFSEAENREFILAYITETISRYKENKQIKIWQVENEPFLRTFGECPKLNKEFLNQEIVMVKSLDSSRPVMITESGEFSTWIGGARRVDIVGTSIYRKVYGKLGYVTYPIPPVFYSRKANLIKILFNVKDVIAIEVQAEPWGDKPVKQMTSAEQDISMSLEQFNKNIEYFKNTGFDEGYLWGVEWWYWRKINGDERFWNRAKELF